LIYVTHDQTEALTFADQVVVMTEGEIVQIGTPQALFETPAHRFVGHFIGTPGMNFIACDWRGTARVGDTEVTTCSRETPPQAASLLLGIRPEYVSVHDTPGANRIPATVRAIHDQGTQLMIELRIGDQRAWSKLRDTRQALPIGDAFAYFPPDKCALYANERRLA
jgi:glycerol transport system ATP-binding protein